MQALLLDTLILVDISMNRKPKTFFLKKRFKSDLQGFHVPPGHIQSSTHRQKASSALATINGRKKIIVTKSADNLLGERTAQRSVQK